MTYNAVSVFDTPSQEELRQVAGEEYDCAVSWSAVLGSFIAIGKDSIGVGSSAEKAARALHPVTTIGKDPMGALIAALIPRDERGLAVTKNHEVVDKLRSKISGWHFSREALSEREYDMSYTAEQLMHLIDGLVGGYLR